MANNPSTLSDYNGQINPPDANYPYGSARDDVTPGDLTGTPRVAAELKDAQGFQQALLVAAGIVPSGNADKVGASQYLDAIIQITGNFSGRVFASVNDMKANADSRINAEGQKISTGGTAWKAVSYDTGVPISNTAPLLYAKPLTRMNMCDFGADPTGLTVIDTAWQEAIDIGAPIKFPTGSYSYSAGATSTKNQDIDLGLSVLTRTGGQGGFLGCDAGDLTIKNGTVDNNNGTSNFGHLIRFDSTGRSLLVDNINLLNQVAGAAIDPANPTKSIDTDLLNVQDCASCIVRNSKFRGASRQGISLTNPTPYVEIVNNEFEDCYLFGVDIEPNASTTWMYDTVKIVDNKFINCGRKDGVNNWVWNSGGPFAVASAATNTVIVKDLIVTDNLIESTDFLAPVGGGVVAPFAKLDQYRNLDFKNNEFKNIERLLLATNDPTSPINRTTVQGNSFNPFSGSFNTILYTYNSVNLEINDNPELRGVFYSATQTVIFTGNMSLGALDGFKAADDRPQSVTISANAFKDCATCINTDNLTERYSVTGNHSIGDTTFMAAVTNSTVSDNTHDGINGNGQKRAVSNASGVDVRVDASQNGYREAHRDARQSSAQNDIYYNLIVESADPQNAGPVAELRAVKDITNANAYGAWELWHGLGSSLNNYLYSSFQGHLLPSRNLAQDNTQNLGSASIRWATVFAGTGTINTSDRHEKQQARDLDDAEKQVAKSIKSMIKAFKFNDAVERKGDGARVHFGVIAQDVADAFAAEGLDAGSYALFCSDEYYELGGMLINVLEGDEVPEGVTTKTRLGIRYDELLAFIISVI